MTALPAKIKQVIADSQIQNMTKAEQIASSYVPFLEQVTEQMNKLKKLKKGDVADVEKARRIRLDLGKICSAVGKQKKADKDLLLLETKFIDSLYNNVEKSARLTQNEAREIEDYYENLEKERVFKLQKEREEKLEPYGLENLETLKLGEMTTEVWDIFYAGTKSNYEAKKAAEKKAEEERIAKEKREAEEREKQRLENEKLKAEIAKKKKEEEKIAKKLEEERLANEKLKKELEEKERKEAEIMAKELALEKERKAEKERLEKAGDKAILYNWLESFKGNHIGVGGLKKESIKVAGDIEEKFVGFKKWAKKTDRSNMKSIIEYNGEELVLNKMPEVILLTHRSMDLIAEEELDIELFNDLWNFLEGFYAKQWCAQYGGKPKDFKVDSYFDEPGYLIRVLLYDGDSE